MLLGIPERIRDFSSKNSIPTRGSAYADSQVDALFRSIYSALYGLFTVGKSRGGPGKDVGDFVEQTP
jgi:hypothetical protein